MSNRPLSPYPSLSLSSNIKKIKAPGVTIRENTTVLENIGDNTFRIVSEDSLEVISKFISILDIETTDKEGTTFRANNVKTLKKKLSETQFDYQMALKMTIDLMHQINLLEQNGYGMPFLSPDDIVVVDGLKFLIIANTMICPRNDGGEIIVSSKFSHSEYMTPYVSAQKSVPYLASPTELYYSIGVLVVFSLLNIFITDKTTLRDVLGPIYSTKLYWFVV